MIEGRPAGRVVFVAEVTESGSRHIAEILGRAAFERLRARNRIVSTTTRKRRRTNRRTSDWKTIRQRQFLREYRSALEDAFAAKGPVIVEAFVNTKEYDDLLLKGNK